MPSSKIQSIEARFGKPIQDVLTELFEQYGSQHQVARVLGVGQGTVSIWLMRLGLEQRTVLVPTGGSRRAGERQPEGALPLPGFEREVSGE